MSSPRSVEVVKNVRVARQKTRAPPGRARSTGARCDLAWRLPHLCSHLVFVFVAWAAIFRDFDEEAGEGHGAELLHTAHGVLGLKEDVGIAQVVDSAGNRAQ